MIFNMLFMAAMWFIVAPMGYLVGDLYNEMKGKQTMLPLICAVFPPVGAVIAATIIIETSNGETL